MHRRRTFLIGGAALWGAANIAHAQTWGDVIGVVVKSQTGGASFTQGEAASGVKEALRFGVVVATTRLGKTDGFFKDFKVHIPLPSTLAKVQQTVKPFGLAGPLDDLELRMNRSAEAAMPAAKKIFLNVVQSLTLSDAISIVRGGETGATTFLRSRTEGDLTKALTPPMKKTLNASGAFSVLDVVGRKFRSYGGTDFKNNLKQQVIDFAVLKTLDGGFHYIGEEERAIRRDPVKRTTEILRKVFG